MKKKSKLKLKNTEDFDNLKLDLKPWEEKITALQIKYGAVTNFNFDLPFKRVTTYTGSNG